MAPKRKNFDDLFGDFLVAGGQQQATNELLAFQATEDARKGRAAGGLDLLGRLTDIQRDPFNIVTALQSFAAAGGGTLAPAGVKSQGANFGPLVQKLIQGLAEFAGATGQALPDQTAGKNIQKKAANVTAGTTTTGGASTPSGGQKAASAAGQTGGLFTPDSVAGVDGSGGIQPIGSGAIDRSLLPQNIQDAIALFEQNQGQFTAVGQAVADASISDLNRNANPPVVVTPKEPTPTQQLFDRSVSNSGGQSLDPTVVEQTIRNALAKRQTRRGARNQLATSRVGQAAA